MALNKVTENRNGGGIRRRQILVHNTADLAITLATVSGGNITSDAGKNKNIRSRITALDSTKQEVSTLVAIQGRVIANGLGTLAIYLWATANVTLPANAHLLIEIDEDLTANGD